MKRSTKTVSRPGLAHRPLMTHATNIVVLLSGFAGSRNLSR